MVLIRLLERFGVEEYYSTKLVERYTQQILDVVDIDSCKKCKNVLVIGFFCLRRFFGSKKFIQKLDKRLGFESRTFSSKRGVAGREV
jgi:hypothetical protein